MKKVHANSALADTGFRQIFVKLTSFCTFYLRHYILTVHVDINSNYIKVVSIIPYFTHSMEFNITQFQTAQIERFKILVHKDGNYQSTKIDFNLMKTRFG